MRNPIRIARALSVVGAVLAVVLVASGAPAGAAPSTAGNGVIKVTVRTPEGIPATVPLAGKTRVVAAKAPAGTSAVVTLTVPVGTYHVPMLSTTFDGVRYIGFASAPVAVVRRGATSTLNVGYVPDGGARQLHVAALTQTRVELTWSAPAGSLFILRRTPGTTPVTLASVGVGVPTKQTSAVDAGLQPGTQYTYSLFTVNRYGLSGPLVIVVNTAPAAGAAQAATYVAAPTTWLVKPGELASTTATGTAVRLGLQAQTSPPLIGAGVVLPVSAELPGGFLGVVTAVSADGRIVELRSGALIDAFDFYEVNVPDFAVSTPAAAATLQKTAPKQGETRGAKPAAAKAAAGSCSGGADTVSFDPGITIGGHFATKVDKYKFLGVQIPTGASVDLGLTATVTGAATIGTTASLSCELKLPKLARVLVVTPVPISLVLTPSAGFTVAGSVAVTDLGLTASAGFQVNGSMSVKNGPSFSGSTSTSVTPLTPKVTRNGSVSLKVGGNLALGPGVGSDKAGVVAGLSGDFNPVDAKFTANFPADDTRFNVCTKAEAAATWGLGLTVDVWLSKWTYNHTVTLDALNGAFQYPGSPWTLPTGCDKLPAEQNKDSLLGPGVTKVDDVTVGGVDQWGHVEGFVPGKKTWVLSTGKIADALGTPSAFASTNLGRDGDPQLSALAGYPTHDAASYTVTLKPTGSTLHVRYVFASEEYPEFVGSSYNDVMVVLVDGKNCATVPGTDTPVAVNTINDHTNSGSYVDNSSGAAGYSTSMDGLTVPLTCSVPVTPGKQVTVRIAVADTTDHIYDSAVALVDGGIWTD